MWFQEHIDKYVDTLVFDPTENTVSWVLDGICAADTISDETLSAYCRRYPQWFHSPLLRHENGGVRVADIWAWAVHASTTHETLMTTMGKYRCCTINISRHPCESPEVTVDELRDDGEDVTYTLMNAENSKTMHQTYALLNQLPGRQMTIEPYLGFPVAPKGVYRDRDKYIETLVFDPTENTVSWMQDGICTANSVPDEELREVTRTNPPEFHTLKLFGRQEVGFSELLTWATLSEEERDPFRMHILTSKVGELIFCTLNVILHPVDGSKVVDLVLDDWNLVKRFVHEADRTSSLAKNLPLLLTFPGYDAAGGRSF